MQLLHRSELRSSSVARELNARGVPAPTRTATNRWRASGLWSVSGVRNILKWPTYRGDMVWNRQHMGAYHTVRNGEITTSTKPRHQVRKNDVGDWLVFPDTHEALVDRATFERVQKKLTARREGTSSPAAGGPFLFTGLAKCGDCGWPMYGINWWGKDDPKGSPPGGRTYVCGQYNCYRKAGCNSNTIEERDLLEAVLGVIEGHFLKSENLAVLKAEIRRQERAERAGAEPKAAALDRRIVELTSKIDTAMER
jgi:hypothetical protein